MNTHKLLAIGLGLLAVANNSWALTDQELQQALEDASDKAAEKTVEETSKREFEGLSLGVGLSLTFDTGSNDRVESATLVDGVVRVTKEKNKVARVLLESHYFFPTTKEFLVPAGQWGWGPFFGVQPGTDNIIEAIGLGFMIGFRRENSTSDSWNIGLGYIVDPEVTVLGDGLKANEPLPGNETEVRLKTTSQQGVLLVFSASF